MQNAMQRASGGGVVHRVSAREDVWIVSGGGNNDNLSKGRVCRWYQKGKMWTGIIQGIGTEGLRSRNGSRFPEKELVRVTHPPLFKMNSDLNIKLCNGAENQCRLSTQLSRSPSHLFSFLPPLKGWQSS